MSYAPPPPPPPGPASTLAAAPGPVPPASRGASPWLFAVIGLLLGAIAGFAGGYAFRGTQSPAPAATASPTPTAAASVSPTPLPPQPTATQAALSTPQPVTGLNPTGIDQTGTGDGQVPSGATFMINPTWAVSLAWSCPPGSAGAAGQGTVVKVAVQPGTPGLSTGDTTETDGTGDSGSRVNFEDNGGNFILKVTSVNAACQWHVVIYGKTG